MRMEEAKHVIPKELYRTNREHFRYLCDEAENQQLFVAFALPSSGRVWVKH